MFVVVGGGASGVSEPAPAGERSGVGRRGQSDPDARRTASRVRGGGCWLRTGSARHSTPTRTVMCAARVAGWWCSSGSAMRCVTGIGAGGGARFGGQPGRSQQRADGAQSGRPSRRYCARRWRRRGWRPSTSTTSRRTAPARRWVIRSRCDALGAVFGERDGAAPLVLGAVKTNLGHLESAAGIAGFIKTVLSVGARLHSVDICISTQLTPHASAGASRFIIAAEPMHWPAVGRAAAGGGVVVRCQWHQCACGDGAGSGCRTRCRGNRSRW